jgi:ent-kaurene synthase
MMTEAEWQISQYVPTLEEYMTNGIVSFALGPIVLPALYFVDEKISGCVVKDQEHSELFRLMSTCGRLLNDIQGFEVLKPACADVDVCVLQIPFPPMSSRFHIAA